METKATAYSSSPLVYIVLILVLFSLIVCSSAAMSFNFYGITCPTAEFMVRNAVRSASSTDPTIPGKLLRLLFHDCFVENYRVVTRLCCCKETTRNEVIRQTSLLEGLRLLILLKECLKSSARQLSLVLILLLWLPEMLLKLQTGGPAIQIPTGRRDGTVSAASNVRPNMVDTSFTMNEMIQRFTSKGLSLDDLVTLTGAHTIGTAHCSAFSDRFKEDSKGKFTLIDSSLDRSYADELIRKCPVRASALTTVNNDPETSFVFDNQYYRNLMAHRGLFQSDSVLLSDGRTRKQVEDFANDQVSFFQSWEQSFLKLSIIGVKTGDEGEIRLSCPATNM